MSAAALMSDVTVTRSGREEITLRLDEDEPAPAAREEELRRDAGPSVPAERERLLDAAQMVELNGHDPAEVLYRYAEKLTKRSAKVGPRVGPLLERERRIRERAAKTASIKVARAEDERDTGKKSETHRKKLRRTLKKLVVFGYVRDPGKKRPIWAALDDAERRTALLPMPAAVAPEK